MRYDDSKRPVHEHGATKSFLQTNGSPLPVITLMYPMQDGGDAWGWLACIHAHRAANRFGTYYGWLGDLNQFSADYMNDPENALRKYFKYNGPEWEPTEHGGAAVQTEKDIFNG